MEGHFRVTGVDPTTKQFRVFVDKKNTIMQDASLIVANGFVGNTNSSITHLYLAFSNDPTYPAADYVINFDDTTFLIDDTEKVSCLRIPLTFPPIISSLADPGEILVSFNILVNQPGIYEMLSPGILNDDTSDPSKFFEAALVNQSTANATPLNPVGDRILARVAFDPLAYDSTFNLTVSWGIKLSV